MDFSIVIAQVLGIFFVITGISIVANGKATARRRGRVSAEQRHHVHVGDTRTVDRCRHCGAQQRIGTSGFALLVTLLGWLALIKGTFILLLPGVAASLYKKCGKSNVLVVAGVVMVVLGLVLLYW